MKEQPSRKAGTLIDKNVFGFFKHFINEDDKVRVQGACSLIEFLCKDSHRKPNVTNGADEKPNPKTAETAYALKRLVRGVGSSQNASRIGFFTGLVGLLGQLKNKKDCPTVTDLLTLVGSELNDSECGIGRTKAKKNNARFELRAGNVLVCGAIIKSGLIENASEMELQKVLDALKNDMYKSLKPLAYTFLSDLASRLDSSKFSKVFWPVFEPFLNVSKEMHSLDSLFFLLQLSTGTHKKLVNHKYFERNFGVSKLLHEGNFPYLSSLLFGIDSAMAINHPFLNCLLEFLNKEDMMVVFWRDAIVPVLEKEGEHRPKFTDTIALRLMISILGQLKNLADVPEVLQPAVMKFFLSKLKNRTKYSEDSQNLYQEVCVALAECYPKMEDENVRLATIRRLMQAPSSVLIDKYAPCKLLLNLIVTLSAESLRELGDELKLLILDESTGTNAERTYAAQILQRILSLRQLTAEANGKGQIDRWHLQMVQFLLNLGVFYSADGVSVLKSSKQEKAISEELAGTLRGLFISTLEHRHAKLSNEQEFLLSIVRHVDETMRMHGGVKSLRNSLTEEQIACWHKMFATVSGGTGKKQFKKRSLTGKGAERDTKQSNIVFHILLMQMGLHLFIDPELACSSLIELECVMKKIEEKAKHRQKSNGVPSSIKYVHKKQQKDEYLLDEEESEPEWIEVVVDLFLNLLSQNSHLLRKVIGHVFPHLSSEITLPALNQILSVINLKDKSNPLAVQGEEENESEIEEEDKDSDEEIMENDSVEDVLDEETNDNDNEEEEDEDDEIMGDEEEEENITDNMRLAVQTALGGANPETDTESIDLDEMDEEQGRQLDEALAAAFRAFRKKSSHKRKGPTKAEQQMDVVLTHFRMRVLDLIDAYLKHEPDMILCLELMQYIFEMLPVAIREEAKYGVILNRYKQIFNNLVRIKKFKSDTQSVQMEQLSKILRDLIEKVAKGAAFPERNLYLMKACQFIVICSQMLNKQQANVEESNVVENTFNELLGEFLINRNPPITLSVFQNIFRMHWNGNWCLLVTLVKAGLKVASVRAIRRIQTLQLMRELLRNRRLINSDQPRSARLMREICANSLTPYITDLEAAIIAGDRTIGQNEVYELMEVLVEIYGLSSVLCKSENEDKKKGKKQPQQFLRWEKIGLQVQAMRRFVLTSQTMTCYRKLCQRLNLEPIGNEGLPVVEKNVSTTNVESADRAKNGDSKKVKSKNQKKINGTVDLEEDVGNNDETVVTMINGHGNSASADEDYNDDEELMEDGKAQNQEHGTPNGVNRKRKKEKKNGEVKGLSKRDKRRRKEVLLQAASVGMEEISFVNIDREA
ncbi:myb-binding protein 1A [Anopheles nili]|uniref:myb-binding protein 1A n=1 Tax=Anopheles nili TaxID=185578 RepID=UPI00237B66FD|nr:myb-binding protein 1A [Anopheles nili]